MPDQSSPLWWLFAAISAGACLALIFPAMVNGRQKAFVACGPVMGLLAAFSYSSVSGGPLAELLPVYCALFVALVLGLVGQRAAMREFMTWKQNNPGKPDSEGPGTPWIPRMVCTLAVFVGPAIWYVSG